MAGHVSVASVTIFPQFLHQFLKLHTTHQLFTTSVIRDLFLHPGRCCLTPREFSNEQASSFAGIQFISWTACAFCVLSRNHCQVQLLEVFPPPFPASPCLHLNGSCCFCSILKVGDVLVWFFTHALVYPRLAPVLWVAKDDLKLSLLLLPPKWWHS